MGDPFFFTPLPPEKGHWQNPSLFLIFSLSLFLSHLPFSLSSPFLPSFSQSFSLFPSPPLSCHGKTAQITEVTRAGRKKINFWSLEMRMLKMNRRSQRRKLVGVLPPADVSRASTAVSKTQQCPSDLRNLGHVSSSSSSLNFSICQMGMLKPTLRGPRENFAFGMLCITKPGCKPLNTG